MALTEIQPTQEELRESAAVKRYGRRVHENSAFRTTQPEREPHTDENKMEFDKIRMRGGLWVPKSPKKTDDGFVWKITSFTTAVLGADEEQVRVQFQIQKCYANEFISARRLIEVAGGEPERGKPEKLNKPWSRRTEEGDLKDTGERMLDASDFINEFKELDE